MNLLVQINHLSRFNAESARLRAIDMACKLEKEKGRKMETVFVCAECGEEVSVSSRKAVNNNMGELAAVKVFLNPCKCTEQEVDNTNDYPSKCDRCHNIEALGDLIQIGNELICKECAK